MRLGLDLLFLVPGATGGRETYARELLGALREVEPDLHVTTFVGREAAGPGWWSALADRTVVLPRASAVSRGAWAAGEVGALPRAAARAGVEVLHGPANFAPLHGPFARVVTVHDLLFRALPELMTPVMRLGTEALVPPAARRAHRVLTVSQASAAEIAARLGIPAGRIDVAPNGVAAPGIGRGAAARALLGAGERPVVLAVGSDLPHKNLRVLAEAVGRIDDAERPLLALAGPSTERLAGGLGAVSAQELEDLYAGADVYATTTLFEGFGLPVLEAMVRGVPVVCSDLPVLREVAGEAAVFTDPRDPDAVARALLAVLRGRDEVDERVAAGRERAASFTWERAARLTLASYERALSAAGRR